MKKIGQIYGLNVYIDEYVMEDSITIFTPNKETSELIQDLLTKLFQPGKWEFVKKPTPMEDKG